jgi:hypothetical protein
MRHREQVRRKLATEDESKDLLCCFSGQPIIQTTFSFTLKNAGKNWPNSARRKKADRGPIHNKQTRLRGGFCF